MNWSAATAKKAPKVKAARVVVETVYTIDGNKYTFAEVADLVRTAYPDCVVTDKKIKARLERGYRDLKKLSEDKLPHYRPMDARGRYRA